MNLNIGSVLSDVAEAVHNRTLDVGADGRISIKGKRLGFVPCGVFTARVALPGEDFGAPIIAPNRFVGQGLNRILNLLGNHVAGTALFIAPFTENVSIDDTLEAADFATVCGELTNYTPNQRLPWNTAAATAKVITNQAALNAATLTLTGTGPYTIRGLALLTASAKGSALGDLIVASRLPNDIVGLPTGSRLSLEYALSALDEADA